MKNTYGGVLISVKLQAEAFTKSNTAPQVFFTFFKLYEWDQIVQSITFASCPFFVEVGNQNKNWFFPGNSFFNWNIFVISKWLLKAIVQLFYINIKKFKRKFLQLSSSCSNIAGQGSVLFFLYYNFRSIQKTSFKKL